MEISSDEEGDGGGDNFDWISKMLLNEQTDESDDVVILLNLKQMFDWCCCEAFGKRFRFR